MSVHCASKTDGGGGLRAHADALKSERRRRRACTAPEKIVVRLFGCGGDRDKGKRPPVGIPAHRDIVVVTDDNPRTEEPRAIINDILAGMLDAGQVRVSKAALRR